MAESLGFEQKVQGLMEMHQALVRLDPQYGRAGSAADPRMFYFPEGRQVSDKLSAARKEILQDLANQGRAEYGRQQLHEQELTVETKRRRMYRAGILAIMTGPATPEIRSERAGRIAGILGSIVSGESLEVTTFDKLCARYEEPYTVQAEPGRQLYGVFANGHISERTLTVQYDTPDAAVDSNGSQSAQALVEIGLTDLYRPYPLLIARNLVQNAA